MKEDSLIAFFPVYLGHGKPSIAAGYKAYAGVCPITRVDQLSQWDNRTTILPFHPNFAALVDIFSMSFVSFFPKRQVILPLITHNLLFFACSVASETVCEKAGKKTITLALEVPITFCVKSYYILRYYYILCQLLHFVA